LKPDGQGPTDPDSHPVFHSYWNKLEELCSAVAFFPAIVTLDCIYKAWSLTMNPGIRSQSISMRLMHNFAAPPVRPLGTEGERRLFLPDQGHESVACPVLFSLANNRHGSSKRRRFYHPFLASTAPDVERQPCLPIASTGGLFFHFFDL
jgi:hypothetical protein